MSPDVGVWGRQGLSGEPLGFTASARSSAVKASDYSIFIDPTAGSTFEDSSGNTQPAWATSWAATNSPVHSSAGWVLTNDWFTSSGNPGNLDGTTLFVAFTVDSASGNEGIAGARPTASLSTQGWDIRRSSTNVSLSAGDGTSSDFETTAYTNDTYASVALSFITLFNAILTYRDGVLDDPIITTGFSSIYPDLPLEVGAVAGTIGLNGTIHGLVWNSTALDAAEIARLHNHFAGVAGA